MKVCVCVCACAHIRTRRNWWQWFIHNYTCLVFCTHILMGSNLTVWHEPAFHATHPPQHLHLQKSETLYMTHQYSRVRSLVEKPNKYGTHPLGKGIATKGKSKSHPINKNTFRKNHRKTLTQQGKKSRNIFISNNEIEGTDAGLINSRLIYISRAQYLFYLTSHMSLPSRQLSSWSLNDYHYSKHLIH